MNSTTKCIISFAIGSIIGAVGSFLVTKYLCEKQCTEIIEGIRDFYKKRDKELEETQEDYTEFVRNTSKIAYVPPNFTDYTKICSECKCEEDYSIDLELGTEYGEEYPEEGDWDGEDMHPEDSIEEEHIIKPLHPKNIGNDPPPYIITEQEYFAEDGLCQRDVLTYYEKDGILADDMDDIIDVELVGEENLEVLKTEDAIYVKNFECGMKWEICKSPGAFYDLKNDEKDK